MVAYGFRTAVERSGGFLFGIRLRYFRGILYVQSPVRICSDASDAALPLDHDGFVVCAYIAYALPS